MDKSLKDHKDELRTLILEMTPEQLEDYFIAALEINKFAEEMKKRFAQKTVEGRGGWQDSTPFDLKREINERARRLLAGEDEVDIGIANWAFIHWFNRNKPEPEPEEIPVTNEQVRQTLERLILATPTGDVRDALTLANISILNIQNSKEKNEARK